MDRDVAQPGRALRSGRRCRWFESSHPDQVVSRYLSNYLFVKVYSMLFFSEVI